MGDPWRLDRYVTAQERGGTYQRAVAELRAGAKVSHWMWFVFPQIAGLGMSAMSREYAISSIAEARAYLDHPVLGPRLVECAGIVAGTEGRSAERIFGPVDAMKLRSSMTLFAAAADDKGGGEGQALGESGGNVFRTVLAKFFGGVADEATLARLLRRRPPPAREDGSPSLGRTEADELRAERPQPGGRGSVPGQRAWLGEPGLDEVAAAYVRYLGRAGQVDRGPGAGRRAGPERQRKLDGRAWYSGDLPAQGGAAGRSAGTAPGGWSRT